MNRSGDEAHAPRRATGIPTSVLAAQQRIRRDGTLASGQAFDLPVQPGEIINGKYRVRELLGVGGVGFVMSAKHIQLDDDVALKILKPEFASHPEAVQSFTTEARTSFRLRSEHIVRVHDVDVLPSGIPFMVMELMEGQDLRRILKKHRHMSIELAVDVALQTCEALAAAHACQIVHRDIKPENLFLIPTDATAHIKVLDFGISQASASATVGAQAVSPGMAAVGTPPYMSPEQIRGSNELDGRADVWSLGCVLYELLTGFAPFARMSIMQACAAVLEDEPAPLRETRPDLPLELEDVVLQCLRKQPSQRFLSVAELANALAPFGKHSAYCAERCNRLLAKESSSLAARAPSEQPASPSSGAIRLPTGTQLRERRVQTSVPNLGSVSNRRQTMNPLSTPTTYTARRPSSLGLAPPPARPPEFVQQQEDTDMSFVPGLRPRRTRWVLLATGASIAAGVTYLLANVELDRTEPSRMLLQEPTAPELVLPDHHSTNAQRDWR